MIPLHSRGPAGSPSWGRLQKLLLPFMALIATGLLAAHYLLPGGAGTAKGGRVSMQSTKTLASGDLKMLSTYCKAKKTPDQHVYLVTGAAGFIGFHLAGALTKRGDLVVGLDNFNSYYPVSLKRSRAASLLKEHQVPVLDADLNDYMLMLEVFDTCKFTHVVHLAAQAGVRYAKKAPQTYVASNLAGFVNVLEVIVHQKVVPRCAGCGCCLQKWERMGGGEGQQQKGVMWSV